jgi:1,4-alpha-glucan branching enzyme
MLFQGQEFLEGGWFRDTVALDWSQDSSFRGIVRLYRDLIGLRLNRDGRSAGLTGGGLNVFHNNDAANVLAFQRWRDHGPGDDVVVVVNLSAETLGEYRIGFPTGGTWKLLLNSDAKTYSDAFGDNESFDALAGDEPYDGFGASAELSIGPYSVLVYSLEP